MSSPTDGQAPTWSEPPWSGWIETTGDALLILEAARRGLIPRVTRRLVDSERKMITSGSVFVFDEDESGIKRWTDGFFWSPSRILGNFLLYRETEKKGQGHRGKGGQKNNTQDDLEPSSAQYSVDGGKVSEEGSHALSRPRSESSRLGIDRHRERSLVGSLTNSYKFKTGGMMKKTFSLTINGVAQHLISYYKVEDVEQGRLRSPSSYPELASLEISPEYLDKTHFRNPPKTEQGIDGLPRYRGEADDVEPSPHSVLDHALSLPVPILSAPTEVGGTARRSKRFDPYASSSKASRSSRGSKKGQSSGTPPPGEASAYATSHSGYPSDPTTMMSYPYAYPYGVGMAPPSSSTHPQLYSMSGHSVYSTYHGSPPQAQTGFPSPTSPMAGTESSQPAPQSTTAGSPTSSAPLTSYDAYSAGPPATSGSDSSQQQQHQGYYHYFSPPTGGYSPYWHHGYPGYSSPALPQQIAAGSTGEPAPGSASTEAGSTSGNVNGSVSGAALQHQTGESGLVGVTVGT